MRQVELTEMTPADWVDAKTGMNNNAFNKLVRIARAGGVQIPSVVVANFSPRITFGSVGGDSSTFLRVKDVEAAERFNSRVKQWSEVVEQELKQSADARFGHRATDQISTEFPRLSESIKTNLRFDKQFKLETRSVGFSIARHGVYLHQGAGKGYAGLTGSKWTDKYDKVHTTAALSMGKMGTGNRTAEPWFNDIIRSHEDELADILAEYSLDLVLNMNSIFLPE